MREFRAYIIDGAGHITLRVDIVVEDEAEARERAKLLVDGRAVELWEGATRLDRFEPISRH
ncbi:hypothetical protein CT676_41850 [Bradyrhizobium sp. MOS001]|jgi:hypothetical protein|uniref:Uncharacterized protein n=1 Tax=Bradyrhizobium japonicum TaxID=375 RepID=A0A1Y2JTG7_BRAJP|nr:hypothetical protein BSZ19_09605 [Bradyrhizobium japonicum]TFW52961.1 hypothetical protein CT676_41850 [Bradyrhizobium sp. MOS001]